MGKRMLRMEEKKNEKHAKQWYLQTQIEVAVVLLRSSRSIASHEIAGGNWETLKESPCHPLGAARSAEGNQTSRSRDCTGRP